MAEDSPHELLTVARAEALIDEQPVQPRIVSASLRAAVNSILAEPLSADRDDPPFRKSLMDGYAARRSDLEQIPRELTVIGSVAAGQAVGAPVEPGTCCAIMTGAPLPDGADLVVPVEDTVLLPAGDEVALVSRMEAPARVRVVRAELRSRHYAEPGSDCRAGAVLLNAGQKIGPVQLAVAASVGAAHLKVYDRPRVGLLATGDELVPVDQAPGVAQRRNASAPMLRALLERFGAQVTELPTAPDDPAKISAALTEGIGDQDLLVITGGMSMGQHDYVPGVLADLGAKFIITKLRIKPGKPFIFASLKDKYVVGLPGNPVSGYVCVVRLVSRLLARMVGVEPSVRQRFATLELPLERNGAREFYQPASFDGTSVWPLRWKSSADIYTLAQANALIIRPENAFEAKPGEPVPILELPG